MTRVELREYIFGNYSAVSDFPWERYPSYEVFRHPQNRKWFLLLMEIPAQLISSPEPSPVAVANMKCDPVLSGSLMSKEGIHPAYHMNKEHWITVEIERADDDTVRWLLDMSYRATAPHVRANSSGRGEKKEKEGNCRK